MRFFNDWLIQAGTQTPVPISLEEIAGTNVTDSEGKPAGGVSINAFAYQAGFEERWKFSDLRLIPGRRILDDGIDISLEQDCAGDLRRNGRQLPQVPLHRLYD